MKKQKHWYDYLWIWTILYFALGFFNILFAWLGMIDFCCRWDLRFSAGTSGSATTCADGDSSV